jgi:hypothetical protein
VSTKAGRKARRTWGRRATAHRAAPEAEELPVRWHSTESLPGGSSPERTESRQPVPIRGAQAGESQASAETRTPPRPTRSEAAPQPPKPRGRHRVKRKLWAPAPKAPKRRTRRGQRRRGTRRALVRKARPIAIVVLAVAVLAAAWIYVRRDDDATAAGRGTSAGLPVVTTTALIAGTETPGGEATWLAVLSYDPAEDRAAVVYVPAHTAVEVPGRGLQGIGGAMTGGLDLLEVSAQNLFPGLNFTHTTSITREGVARLLAQTGPLTVDVPTEVTTGTEDAPVLLFSAGLQELSPQAVADLLYTKGLEDDDVDLGARQLAVWDALFDSYRASPQALSAAVMSAGRPAGLNEASTAGLARLFERIATLPSDRLTLTVLPVEQVGVGGSELYDTSEEELDGFVDETLSGTAAPEQFTVQVLNGVGTPGLGEKVANALIGEGYRVTLTGNVDGFGEPKTLLVTYDPSPDGIAAAERARRLLGAGEVQVSGQGQVSVDMTIVVGKDFLKR